MISQPLWALSCLLLGNETLQFGFVVDGHISLWVLVRRRQCRTCSVDELFAGVALMWLVPAAVTSVWLPGTSYLFAWSAAAASLVVLLETGSGERRRWVRVFSLALVATPVLVLMVPAIDTFLQRSMPRPSNPDSEIVAVVGGSTLLAFLAIPCVETAWRKGAGSSSD